MGDNRGNIRIEKSVYRTFPSYEMESGLVRLTVVPGLGGKIVSLLYKPTGKEWLIDSGSRKLAAVPYGSNFIQADVSGWDECFPTIVACEYPEEGEYFGRKLPDHGELWSVPWEIDPVDGRLAGRVDGIALPYRFSRDLAFSNESTLRMSYSVENTGDEALTVFWTAHPLFAATEHTRIVLPEGLDELLCVDGGKVLEKGKRYSWPHGDGGLTRPLDRIGPRTALDSRKFYAEQALTQGLAVLRENDTGEYVEMAWSKEQLPYFGFWIDEGEHTGYSVCALEPCNGYYDSLTEAVKQGKHLRIAPGEIAGWNLDVRFGNDRRAE
ncbi:hypothetical protein [Cohnella herbarum]|uniref:Aldose 1-epimerase n=1 Tax=Cohnella herbarum TaxID=2728023 RepID=A0A7Z2VPY2_9BACL|nr:hypothetical protein [Cohnella herbarum]QJD87326.1 hypothetical protein HH215_31885 [Cohnella herbarum]